ncbi:serine/threonine-protein phosphatase 6 regulatory ankyrin repeat subunit A-like [Haliotis rubra]|uniref:serine/threonine-protein phosphatase 6 regulatory ankyrin repeat subunit A-like n=1 Tax=Haliotis rubra TaxID=36100 RepID=UPI001EE57A1B|nr:serine/threonine-protein phosphatase 6 regulatory ankyrin repeat subunit A-like [Haliotis rubra]
MEEGQRSMGGSDIEIGGCTPADTPSDGEHLGCTGIATCKPYGASEEAGMEYAENRVVDEEKDGLRVGTEEEEGDGIQNKSPPGAEAKSLEQNIVGCCQSPQGEISATPQQQQRLHDDPDERTDQAHLSTSTTCVVQKTRTLQVPGTTALTPASTSSPLPRIPGPVVSDIQLSEVPMNGDSPAVTQYNLIQVQQKFGDVTVKGAENLNIGGTQNIGTTPTNKEEEEIPLTAAQKIRKRTASRIQSWTEDMVETDALKKVKEKLDRGATWVTIKGRPGEGKSTTAYMALKDQDSQGRQVYQVVSPEEFNEVITACANPVIMLDDIFGDLDFDAAQWTRWRPSLRPILDVKHPDKYADKDALGISTKPEKVLERTKVGQTQVKSPNKDKTVIILVGRDYVLNSSLADLGRMADYISSPQYLVEVSSQRGSYERRQIWRVHAGTKSIHFEDSTVSSICEIDCPHGFPHVCKMSVAAYEKDWTPLQTQMLFQAPLDFLRMTLENFVKDGIKRSLFMAMIKRDGKISGHDLEEDDNLGYEGRAAADDMVGSYLKKEGDTFVFDHPSIYDSVSFILSTKLSKFVINNCSLSFINQRLRLAPSIEKEKTVACETGVVANISWTYAGHLARRFASEIERSNLLYVLSHQACCNADFVGLLMDCLKTRFHMRASDIVKLTDNLSKKSFCEVLSSSKSDHLIKYIMETENISFTQSERRDLLLGVCRNAACSVLKYISGHMELDVNARYGWRKVTPLMLAAKTRDSEFVNQIISLHPDLNARDKFGQSTFYYLCESGLTSAVAHAIDMGVEVSQDHGSDGHPLYHAIEEGHLEIVKLLVNRKCDLDNQKGLACAVRSLNANMLRYFLDRGAVIDGSVVCRACEVGHGNIFEMLFENGATVNTVLPNGDTPLLSSCEGNPTVVSCLLKKGASVNQASNVTGDTPLHRAARRGSTQCIDVLVKAEADVNLQNNTGDTPLHRAAGRGFTECVDVLLKVGADVNVQNNTGDTSLHAAAARWVSTESIDVLLRAGADVNVHNSTGDTPLHRAAAAVWESTRHVDVLVKAGADVNVQNNTGDTPLHRAAAADIRPSERVDVLLKAGADVNVQNNTGDTPLHSAATKWRSTKSVDALVKAGADVNAQNNTGETPLHRAARLGSTQCVDVLVKAGADVNVQNNTGDTPLHAAAAWWGSSECVDVLLKAGADINVKSNTGETPLHRAARRGSTQCVDVLVKAGADVDIHSNTGDTPLHRADTPLHTAAAEWGSTECVDALLKARADVNVQNNTGDTPLHRAATWGSTECVDVLVKAGVDVNVQNNTGDTPLHAAAAERGSTKCVDVLLKAGADVKAAAERGSTKCVDVLLKAGAHVNVQNNTGDTPLHRAARWESAKCVDVLVKAGADIDVQNNTGDTSRHIAARCESTACFDVLLKAGADVNVQNNAGATLH